MGPAFNQFVCVIGAGTMGSGIAAHLANLGFNVSLLDITAEAAEAGLERAKRSRPPHFTTPAMAANIRTGATSHHPEWISEADWVCEAIFENLEAKRALFEQIEPLLRDDALISTNTSGLEISMLAEGRSGDFRRRFMGTHFFNPPRYLKLLELIPTSETSQDEIERMTAFLEANVGRRVVLAKDTPGFIANRFGMWAMFHAIHTAERLHLSIEQVDAITGPFLGRPRSASFRLNDIVGLDIMRDIAANLIQRCPDDPHCGVLELPKSMAVLLERGWIGDKTGQGYYRREGKELVALDLTTFAYRQKQEIVFPSLVELSKQPLGDRVRAALDLKDEAGEFLREHLVPVLQYADYLMPSISHSAMDFDRVMKWGFGWEQGPFEMIEGIGAGRLGLGEKRYYLAGRVLGSDGEFHTPKPEPQFAAIQDFPIVEEHEAFRLRDLGDGIMAVALTTKMGVITPAAVEELHGFLDTFEGPFVLCSEAKAYSVGYDLTFLYGETLVGNWPNIEACLSRLQELANRLSRRRAVAAVHGYALGGGFELACACPMVVAHPEAMIGFPEAKVGLIPGGSGTARMRLRHQGSAKALQEMAITLAQGAVSSCAEDARKLGMLRATDLICANGDSLIPIARDLAKSVEPTEQPDLVWLPVAGPLGGMIDRAAEELRASGDFTDYDCTICDKIKSVFGKSESWTDALSRERKEFELLLHDGLTQARIKHMLDTGKPLRN